ncbi:hypothetical protein BDV33DRAFT_185339 [Aspergillus novoparasiticus]|uniref:Uncharacterized protein n=1 Tax=Aspergillus novoparasiticus TaxID=986946 RepID=A0A5N6E7S2_9EURO|nr:hypothetical protein BDV33DRAFT_185339 [Aspergillus novoparasiticus]
MKSKKEDTPQVELVPLMVSPTSNKPTSDPGAIEVDDKTDSEETSGLVYLPSPTKGCENMG